MDIKKGSLAIIWLSAVSSPLYALDWLFEPDMSFSERYTDNLRLQFKPQRSNYISTLSPSVILGFIEDNEELQTNLRLNQYLYHDESSLDFTEKLVNVDYKRFGERWSSGLQGSYTDQASLGTESVQLGVNGSGQVSVQVPRFTKSIAPSFSYNLTEKNSVSLSGSYADVNFGAHQNMGLAFSDYISEQISSQFTHKYTEKFSNNISASYSIYTSNNSFSSNFNFTCHLPVGNFRCNLPGQENYSQNSGTMTIQTGFNYAITENWSANASVGIRDTTSKSDTGISSNNALASAFNSAQNYSASGKIYSATINRVFESGNFNVSAIQQLNPASTGTQQQTTQLTSAATYQLTERWTANLNGSYLISKSVIASGSNNLITPLNFNRNLTILSPSIRWQWTSDINLSFSYTYMDQSFDTSSISASSNSMQLQFFYQPLINRQVK